MTEQIKEEIVQPEVERLERKIKGEERNEEPKISVLNDYLEDRIAFYNQYVKQVHQNLQPDTKLLNELFKKCIADAWI